MSESKSSRSTLLAILARNALAEIERDEANEASQRAAGCAVLICPEELEYRDLIRAASVSK